MFLLIREKKKEDFRYYPPLNSIMFLLIRAIGGDLWREREQL